MESTIKTETAENTRKISKTIGYYAAFIALGLTSASLGPTLPGLAAHTHSSLSQVSYLFTARSLGYLLGSLRGGHAYDRLPGHRVQVLALLGMAVMMLIIPAVSRIWLLAAILVLLGFSEGALDVGGNTLLVWVHKEKVGPFMNGLHFFFGIGSFLSPVIVAQALLLTSDITWAYWGLALMLLPAVIFLARQPSPVMPTATRKENEGQFNFGLVGLIMLFFLLSTGAEASIGGWIFTFARALNLGTEVTAAYLTSAFWGALTLGRLLSIPLAARYHPRWILLGDLIGCIASLGLILVGRTSFGAVWIGTAAAGLFMASVFPTTITLAGRYIPINGKITGYFFVGVSLGGMFIPWLIGQLFEPLGPYIFAVIVLTALVMALLVFGILMSRFKQTQERIG